MQRVVLSVVDVVLVPFVFLAGLLLKGVRRCGLGRLGLSRAVLDRVGVLPIRRHYYEPYYSAADMPAPPSAPRPLPGIDLDPEGQREWLKRLVYGQETLGLPLEKRREGEFYFHNGAFESGDAEYLYSMVRALRPRTILEIGSGMSTLMAIQAIRRNAADDGGYRCRHVCIEPFEHAWLEGLPVELIRKRVETVDLEPFTALEENDILFIDSSHVIRPQGDVLCEYLHILPSLRPGVFVHVHDIFTPRDYLREWLFDEVRLWNEQYLLEAFLSFNDHYRVVGAVNQLAHEYPADLGRVCPVFEREASWREPGSFWMVKTK
jgi:predicted O-methyltransferase YrrM